MMKRATIRGQVRQGHNRRVQEWSAPQAYEVARLISLVSLSLSLSVYSLSLSLSSLSLSLFSLSLGTNADFVIGVMLGFILGVISLVCLLNSSVSRKQRLGILVGIALNMLYGLRRIAQEQEDIQNGVADPTPIPQPDPEPVIVNPVGNSR
jgi:hypothetical protein